WMKLVAAALKGAPAEKLVARTYDDLAIEPLYAPARQARPLVARAPGHAWQVMQRVDHPDPAAANAEALHDLENGATGLVLVVAGATGACGYGLDASIATPGRVLEGVILDAASIELDHGAQSQDAAAMVVAFIKGRGLPPETVDLRFGFDPLGLMAATGKGRLPWRDLAHVFAATVADLAAQGFRGPVAVAAGGPVHPAGGSEAQELGLSLAVALAYLRALEAETPLADAARMIFFRLVADADQFLTVAKFRALRKLWARVQEACGLAPRPA